MELNLTEGGNMRTSLAIGTSIAAGFILGAFTLQTIHAQGKPPVFLVIETEVTNVEAYTKEYAPKAQALARQSGGRLLVAGMKIERLEGQPPQRIAIQQWASLEQAKAWFTSPEYKEARKIGDKYAKFRVFAVEGLPQQ
jgi:uncharacterized protein (DUF1330 family)